MIRKIICMLTLAAAFVGCTKDEWPDQPDWSRIPDPSIPVDDGFMKPAACSNTVVAHRGGAAECGAPDNSMAALEYAMSLGCYGMECDIYWTKDNDIIVAHANGDCKVNNLQPWTATVAELRAAGRLSNGEELPTLEEFIRRVMVEGNCTRLVLDVKRVDKPYAQPEYVINAARRACEIVTEMKAKHFVELICTGFNLDAMKAAHNCAVIAEVPIGMNSSRSGKEYGTLGFGWANLSAASGMDAAAGGKGSCSLEEYEKAGVALSVYNVDQRAGDGNAVYSTAAVNYYIANYKRFRTLCSNYPKWLIGKIDHAYKVYDGIRSEADFEAFEESLASDPTGRRFLDGNGEVVLHCDLTLNGFVPLSNFSGTFNGNGKTLTIGYRGDAQQIGLFKRLSGTVRNLTVAGRFESVRSDDSEIHLGAFAAETDNAAIENCTNRAEIVVADAADATPRTMILSGFVGKAFNGVTLRNCRNTGNISFSSPALYMIGGFVGAVQEDDGLYTIADCHNTADFDNAGSNSGWNFMGGIAGKTISRQLVPGETSNYRLIVEECSSTGTISIAGPSKVRASGIVAQTQGAYRISGCTFSGAIESTDATKRDVVIGGIMAMADKECVGLVEGCTFSGRISAAQAGANNFFGGIYGNNGGAASVVNDCRTTASAYVGCPIGKSVGMLAGRPNKKGFTVSNCRIAGTVTNKQGAAVVITADNLEDWMFAGYGTSVAVTLKNNGYNDGK